MDVHPQYGSAIGYATHGQMAVVVKNRSGIPFRSTNFRTDFSGGSWDVHWGYGVLTLGGDSLSILFNHPGFPEVF